MIPINEVIESGAWLHCHKDYDDWCEQELNMRIRILSFDKVNFAEVDNPEKIEFIDEGVYWIMKVEVVSLVKEAVRTESLTESIVLIDQDGFSFDETEDTHLSLFSDYAEKSDLIRFFAREFRPKMKTKGAFTFLLPEDDFAEYSIAVENGTITEA